MDSIDMLGNFNLPLDRQKYEWIDQWLTSKEYMIAALTITFLQSIIMPVLFGLHVFRLIKGTNTVHYERNSPLRIRYIIIDNLSLSSIIFSFISGIITILNYLSVLDTSLCTILTIIQNIFWLGTKVSVYLVVLLRLQAAFWGSVYEINRVFKTCCLVFILLFAVICGTGSIFDIKGKQLPGTNFCLLVIPPWLILVPLMFDILCTGLSMYLFIVPIRKILANSGNNSVELSKLLTKYILISSIALSSNLFSSIWFAVTDILIFTYFDVFLNPICLILMQIHHNDIYYFLCKYCHRSLNRMMKFLPEPSTTERNMIQMQKNQHASSPAAVTHAETHAVTPAISPVTSPRTRSVSVPIPDASPPGTPIRT